MRVLGLIPARGGSKSVPRKNIRPLLGKPLLQYTTEVALVSRRLMRVVLSTDDEEIAHLGRSLGLDVPFIRPGELAQDDTPTLPVVQHAIRWLETRGDQFDAVCLLEPTSPLRQPSTIDGCLELLERDSADAVVTVSPVPHAYNPHWVYFVDADGLLRLSTGEREPIVRRQELPVAYHRDGSVYATRRNVVMNENSLYGGRLIGYVVSSEESLNVDTEQDWTRAETILRCEATAARLKSAT